MFCLRAEIKQSNTWIIIIFFFLCYCWFFFWFFNNFWAHNIIKRQQSYLPTCFSCETSLIFISLSTWENINYNKKSSSGYCIKSYMQFNKRLPHNDRCNHVRHQIFIKFSTWNLFFFSVQKMWTEFHRRVEPVI